MRKTTADAIAAGRRRWVARMRLAKVMGAIARFPGGRRDRGLPPLSKDPRIRRAQRLVEAEMAARRKVRVDQVSDGQGWQERSSGQKLATASDKSLDRIFAFLLLDLDPRADEKLFLAQQQMAMATITNQIKLDSAQLAAQAALANVPDAALSLRLQAAFERLDEVAIENEAENEDGGEGAAAGSGMPAAADGG